MTQPSHHCLTALVFASVFALTACSTTVPSSTSGPPSMLPTFSPADQGVTTVVAPPDTGASAETVQVQSPTTTRVEVPSNPSASPADAVARIRQVIEYLGVASADEQYVRLDTCPIVDEASLIEAIPEPDLRSAAIGSLDAGAWQDEDEQGLACSVDASYSVLELGIGASNTDLEADLSFNGYTVQTVSGVSVWSSPDQCQVLSLSGEFFASLRLGSGWTDERPCGDGLAPWLAMHLSGLQSRTAAITIAELPSPDETYSPPPTGGNEVMVSAMTHVVHGNGRTTSVAAYVASMGITGSPIAAGEQWVCQDPNYDGIDPETCGAWEIIWTDDPTPTTQPSNGGGGNGGGNNSGNNGGGSGGNGSGGNTAPATTLPYEQQNNDGDSLPNGADNCASVANEDQKDIDGDGKGDLCDDNADGDSYIPAPANPDQLTQDYLDTSIGLGQVGVDRAKEQGINVDESTDAGKVNAQIARSVAPEDWDTVIANFNAYGVVVMETTTTSTSTTAIPPSTTDAAEQALTSSSASAASETTTPTETTDAATEQDSSGSSPALLVVGAIVVLALLVLLLARWWRARSQPNG